MANTDPTAGAPKEAEVPVEETKYEKAVALRSPGEVEPDQDADGFAAVDPSLPCEGDTVVWQGGTAAWPDVPNWVVSAVGVVEKVQKKDSKKSTNSEANSEEDNPKNKDGEDSAASSFSRSTSGGESWVDIDETSCVVAWYNPDPMGTPQTFWMTLEDYVHNLRVVDRGLHPLGTLL